MDYSVLIKMLDQVYYLYGKNKTDDKKLYIVFGPAGPKKWLLANVDILLR